MMVKELKKKVFLALCLFLLFSFLPLGKSQGDSEGRIKGKVTNGTKGGGSVANLTVTLKKYQGENEIESKSTPTDPKGNFQFANLSSDAANSYQISLNYQGADYISEKITFEGKEGVKEVNLSVYEATEKDDQIEIVTKHILIEPQGGSLLVTEVYSLKNEGDKTYVGGRIISPTQKETLRFPLPPNFKELNLVRGLMDCCIVKGEEGFVDTMAVKPGLQEAVFSYKVDYSFTKYLFLSKIDYNTQNLVVFIPDKGIGVENNLLGQPQKTELEGKKYLVLNGKGVKKGSLLELKLSKLPLGTRLFKKVAIFLGLALIVFAFIFPLVKKRIFPGEKGISPSKKVVPSSQKKLQAEKERLLSAIVQLDEDLEKGKINKKEYQELREKKKKRLVEINQKLKG